jgi:hypothetical protein
MVRAADGRPPAATVLLFLLEKVSIRGVPARGDPAGPAGLEPGWL